MNGSTRAGQSSVTVQEFDAIYERYAPELWRFAARSTGDSSAADDLVQEVFTSFWIRRKNLGPNVHIRAYLYRTLHNLLIDRARHSSIVKRESESNPVAASGLSLSGSASDPSHAAEESEFERAFQAVLAGLSDQQRTLVNLRWSQGLSFAEIAQVLGISPAAAQKQGSRVLILLKERLKGFV